MKQQLLRIIQIEPIDRGGAIEIINPIHTLYTILRLA